MRSRFVDSLPGLFLAAVCAFAGAAALAPVWAAGPDSWRDAGRLVAGDQFEHDGRRFVVLGDGFDQLRAGPGEVVAAELSVGRLERFGAGTRVRWVARSARAARDWDAERGADR